jgi:hypothetical protein
MKILASFCVSTTLIFGATARASDTTSDSQTVAVERSLQIPGAVLTPGQYTFSVEDRISGRAIVRIERGGTAEHHLLLTVPSSRIKTGAGGGIVLFKASGPSNQILRAWSCQGCGKALEMVYPKLEAAQITADTGQSVIAADPAYNRLPTNLSADDMKVVTLWLLSPERVSNHRGIGLRAAQYAQPVADRTLETADAAASGLPQTASNNYSFGATGIVFLAAYFVLCAWDGRRRRCAA